MELTSEGKIRASSLTSTSNSCEICHSKLSIYGPIWNGPIHCKKFINLVEQKLSQLELKTMRRIKGFLQVAYEVCI